MPTRRVEVTFTVKESGEGQPFIAVEWLRGDPIPEIERKVAAFDMKPGTTLEEAKALAQLLRHSITHLSITD